MDIKRFSVCEIVNLILKIYRVVKCPLGNTTDCAGLIKIDASFRFCILRAAQGRPDRKFILRIEIRGRVYLRNPRGNDDLKNKKN